MNGRDLPLDHGYPVRLIVPGHYGMASVKWLTHIYAMCGTFQGYWQTSDYAFWDELDGKPVRRPLSELMLKSQIARPSTYEVVPGGQPYTVAGAAWCGGVEVVEVEVSADGGQSWSAAEFLDAAQSYTWRRWQMVWPVPLEPGRYRLMARAKDANGSSQPVRHDPNYGAYVINHTIAIEVFVAS
jgi:DMSO/TMAO reductase YedYZ molybdopterin-dependent catalytic subunit